MPTHYDVYHYDPRGAWRVYDECESLSAAKQVVKKNKLTRWKIIKVDSVLVSQSEEDLPKVGNQSHYSA